ncbi:serine/arginine-rich splicing factor SR34B-like [Bidens hawaiensis]|uniref:serine/arginine-rich splicing factor SR34B-like n=1 Tax=Bidens hawaiensis TaxID=980011 RepID=UPI00404A198D
MGKASITRIPMPIRHVNTKIEFLVWSIARINLKVPPRPPRYAFIQFEESRVAEDAIKGRDDRGSIYDNGCGGVYGVSKRPDYRGGSYNVKVFVLPCIFWSALFSNLFIIYNSYLVTGLPSSASWLDLKVNKVYLDDKD